MSTSRLCDHLSLDDFVFLNPTGISLSPDDTRSNFFLHIGLQENIYRHRLIYRQMKAEARAGMDRLFSTRNSLQPELIGNPHVVPPYTLVQITESAFQQEVEKVYQAASRQTRGIYDVVGGTNGNWAIRWMLWRVIQHRLAEEVRASSSGADTTCSMPSMCSSSTKYSSHPHTPHVTSTCYSIKSSWYDSDSEGWDDSDTFKIIKQEHGPYRKPPRMGRSSFWMDVMDT